MNKDKNKDEDVPSISATSTVVSRMSPRRRQIREDSGGRQ